MRSPGRTRLGHHNGASCFLQEGADDGHQPKSRYAGYSAFTDQTVHQRGSGVQAQTTRRKVSRQGSKPAGTTRALGLRPVQAGSVQG